MNSNGRLTITLQEDKMNELLDKIYREIAWSSIKSEVWREGQDMDKEEPYKVREDSKNGEILTTKFRTQ